MCKHGTIGLQRPDETIKVNYCTRRQVMQNNYGVFLRAAAFEGRLNPAVGVFPFVSQAIPEHAAVIVPLEVVPDCRTQKMGSQGAIATKWAKHAAATAHDVNQSLRSTDFGDSLVLGHEPQRRGVRVGMVSHPVTSCDGRQRQDIAVLLQRVPDDKEIREHSVTLQYFENMRSDVWMRSVVEGQCYFHELLSVVADVVVRTAPDGQAEQHDRHDDRPLGPGAILPSPADRA